jgi:hypothetical protein
MDALLNRHGAKAAAEGPLRDEHSSKGYAGAVTAALTRAPRFADLVSQVFDRTGETWRARRALRRDEFA